MRNAPTITLADRANTEHRKAQDKAREAIMHARQAGEALRKAKGACRHGEWLPWLEKHFEGSAVTAQRYMRLAERWPELEAKTSRVTHLSVREALACLSEPTSESDWRERAAELAGRQSRIWERLCELEERLAEVSTVAECMAIVNEADECEHEAAALWHAIARERRRLDPHVKITPPRWAHVV